MSAGFVYILTNDSYNGLIKIGNTILSAQERAKQLSSATGVPTPFRVAYEVYVNDCESIEKMIHSELDDFRVNPNREFFKYPLNKAIMILETMSKNNHTNKNMDYEALEILPDLKRKHGTSINPEISSVRIYQTYERVYLEITIDKNIADYLKDQYIYRTDLGFIGDPIFDYNDNVSINAEKFLDFDLYSLDMCIDNLLTKEASEKTFHTNSKS